MVVTINDGIIPISRPFQFNVVANQAPTVVSPVPSLLLTPQTTNRDYYSDLRQAFADVDNPGTLQWLMTVPASGTASSEVADGQTFTVDFIGTYNVFEFDSSSPASTTPANIPNPITAVQSATGVRESINSVLNSTG